SGDPAAGVVVRAVFMGTSLALTSGAQARGRSTSSLPGGRFHLAHASRDGATIGRPPSGVNANRGGSEVRPPGWRGPRGRGWELGREGRPPSRALPPAPALPRRIAHRTLSRAREVPRRLRGAARAADARRASSPGRRSLRSPDAPRAPHRVPVAAARRALRRRGARVRPAQPVRGGSRRGFPRWSAADTRLQRTRRRPGSAEHRGVTLGSHLLERPRRGMPDLHGASPRESGTEVLSLDLALHGLEDQVTNRASATPG